MARRKRASMREGPLADLFRSTLEGDSGEPETETHQQRKGSERSDADTSEETRALPAKPEAPGPPDPEEVTVYRLEGEQGDVEDPPAPPSRARLRDILIEGDDRGA